MRLLSFLTLFLPIFIFLISLTHYSQAGGCPSPGTTTSECVGYCKCTAEHANYSEIECAGLRGEEKRECLSVYRAINKCNFTDCLGDVCGIVEVESVVCEALDELCLD